VYAAALAELRAGRKRSHWMWFVFPQRAGLGSSPTAQRYAISTPAEARAYLAHPVLGPRLVECTQAILDVEGRSASGILGSIDELKLKSSMTLFGCIAPDQPAFAQVLDKYYAGDRDDSTIDWVLRPASSA
jgi:uncharacterized protein (DUF1810 family)